MKRVQLQAMQVFRINSGISRMKAHEFYRKLKAVSCGKADQNVLTWEFEK